MKKVSYLKKVKVFWTKGYRTGCKILKKQRIFVIFLWAHQQFFKDGWKNFPYDFHILRNPWGI